MLLTLLFNLSLTTQSCSPCLNCLGSVLFLSSEHPQKLRSDWGSIKKKKKSSLWAVCAAGLSALHVAGLIKHSPAWASFKVPGAHGLWKHLFNGGSVCLQGLLLSLDIPCVLCSPTVTSTYTCAGPTTPTCQGRSTPKTRLRVSSWVPVSLQHENSAPLLRGVSCHSLPFQWMKLHVESLEVLVLPSGNLGSKLVEYKEEMYITSDCGKTWRQVRHVLFLSSSVRTWLPLPLTALEVSPLPVRRVSTTLGFSAKLFSLWKWHHWPFCVSSLSGFWGGASHPLPRPRRGDCGHQGHLHPPQDTQVRTLPRATRPHAKPLRCMNVFMSFCVGINVVSKNFPSVGVDPEQILILSISRMEN